MVARETGDKSLLRRALSVQAVILYSTNNPGDALTPLSEALELAETLGDEIGKAAVWNNLGSAFYEAALYADARDCYERATQLATGSPTLRPLKAMALANVAMCCLHMQEYDQGLIRIRAAIALRDVAESPTDMLARVFTEGTYTRLLLAVGRVPEAAERVQLSKAFAAQAKSVRADIAAACAEGLVEVYSGLADVGLSRSMAALEKARAIKPALRESLLVMVEAQEQAGRPDVALVYLHELLEFNREAKTKQILAPFEALGRKLGCHDASSNGIDAVTAAKAQELQAAIDSRIEDLIKTAITSSEQSGYNRVRVFRVGRLAELLALFEGWDAERAQALGFAARLADVGMMVIPSEILRKPRALSTAERRIMDEHTQFGAEVLAKARLAVLQPCVSVAKFHHEKWDGSGPWGMRGAGTPIEARMVALCDSFDSLTHERPWRQALSVQEAIMTISVEQGSHFDPQLVCSFVKMIKDIFWDHKDFEAYLSEDAHENSYVRVRAQIDQLIRGAIYR